MYIHVNISLLGYTLKTHVRTQVILLFCTCVSAGGLHAHRLQLPLLFLAASFEAEGRQEDPEGHLLLRKLLITLPSSQNKAEICTPRRVDRAS